MQSPDAKSPTSVTDHQLDKVSGSPLPNAVKTATPPTEWIAETFASLEVPLVAYIRRRVWGDIEAARDIVQDAFVKLCQEAWPDIEPHATAWLYRTCRNRAIDLTRREGRMSAIHTHADVSRLQDRDLSAPGESAEHDEQLNQLRASVVGLTEQQQEVLRLRLHDGLSYRQIAEVTGLTATNVGYHLHQAISQLRARIAANR